MKLTIEMSVDEIISSIGKKRQTYYDWKRRCPIEHRLVVEALFVRKVQAYLDTKIFVIEKEDG